MLSVADRYNPVPEFCNIGSTISSGIKQIVSTCEAIRNDSNALTQLLKTGRCALFVINAIKGERKLSRLDKDCDKVINFLEGIQFVSVLSSLIPVNKDEASQNEPFLERTTALAFMISDLATGCLWLLSKGIPILGPFSTVAKILRSLDLLAIGAALTGSISDGLAVSTKKWTSQNFTPNVLQLCERITGAASLLLILPGLAVPAAASIATVMAGSSAALGLLRFIYNWHNTNSSSET